MECGEEEPVVGGLRIKEGDHLAEAARPDPQFELEVRQPEQCRDAVVGIAQLIDGAQQSGPEKVADLRGAADGHGAAEDVEGTTLPCIKAETRVPSAGEEGTQVGGAAVGTITGVDHDHPPGEHVDWREAFPGVRGSPPGEQAHRLQSREHVERAHAGEPGVGWLHFIHVG